MNNQEGFKLKSLLDKGSTLAKKGKKVSKTISKNAGKAADIAKKNKKTTAAITGAAGLGVYSAATGTNVVFNAASIGKAGTGLVGDIVGSALGVDPKKMSNYMSYIKNIIGIMMAIYLYFIFGRIGLIAFILIIFVYKFYSKFMTTSEKYQNNVYQNKIYPFNY